MAFSDALGDDPANTAGNFLSVLGASILSGNRYEPFGNFGQLMALKNKEMQGQTSRAALKALLIQAGATPEQAEQFSANEGVAKLALQKIENDKTDAMIAGGPVPGGAVNLGMGPPRMTPPAPSGPAAGASLSGSGVPARAPGEMGALFDAKEKQYGLPPGYLHGTAKVESSFNPNAHNDSGADGVFQFIPSTAKQYGVNTRDVASSTDGAAKLARDNMDTFRAKVGRDPTAAELYMLHQQGPGGVALFQNPSAPAGSLLNPRNIAANGGDPNAPASDFIAKFARKFPNGAAPARVADASGAIGAPRGDGTDIQTAAGPMPFTPSTGDPEAANKPAADAVPATTVKPQFDIPPGQASDTATNRTQIAVRDRSRAQLQAEVEDGLRRIAILGTRGERAKGAVEALKLRVQALQKNLEPTDTQKILAAAAEARPEEAGLLISTLPNQGETTLQKDYGSYRKQEIAEGRTPLSQFDYDRSLRRESSNKPQERFAGGAQDAMLEEFKGNIAKGNAAARSQGDFQNLRAISDRIGAIGNSAETREKIGPYAQALGIPVKDLADIQTFSATIQRLAPQAHVAGSGSTSDIEYKGMLNSLPTLSKDPAARAAVLDTIDAMNQYDIKRRDISRQAITGKISPEKATEQLDALPDPMTAYRRYRAQQGDAAQGETAGQPGQRSEAPAATPVPTTTTDKQLTLRNAREYVKAKPERLEAVNAHLKSLGLPPVSAGQ